MDDEKNTNDNVNTNTSTSTSTTISTTTTTSSTTTTSTSTTTTTTTTEEPDPDEEDKKRMTKLTKRLEKVKKERDELRGDITYSEYYKPVDREVRGFGPNYENYLGQFSAVSNQLDDTDEEFYKELRSGGFFRPSDMKHHDKFYRHKRIDPYNYVDGAKEYVFITKPDLPLLDSGGKKLSDEALSIPYFSDLSTSSGYMKAIFNNLCYSYTGEYSDDSAFIRILTNRCNSNFDLPDMVIEEMQTATNLYGDQILYTKASGSTDNNIDFTLEFQDTKFLEIYHLFKAYHIYSRAKERGIIGPGIYLAKYGDKGYNKSADLLKGGSIFDSAVDTAKGIINSAKDLFGGSTSEQEGGDRNKGALTGVWKTYFDYIINRILYDHMSIYKILVANDGCTILYMAKATGCFPKTISRSALSEIQEKGPLNISIGFKGSGWLEDSNLKELMLDFNSVSLSKIENKSLAYDIMTSPNGSEDKGADPLYLDIGQVSQEMSDFPYIRKLSNNDKNQKYFIESNLPYKFDRYILCWGSYKNETKKTTNSIYLGDIPLETNDTSSTTSLPSSSSTTSVASSSTASLSSSSTV